MIVYGAEVAKWVYELNNEGINPTSYGIGWHKDKLIAGVAIEGFNGQNCWVHIRADGFAPKQFVYAVVSYVFSQCERMTAPIVSSNKKALKLVEHIGFELEGTLKEANSDGTDLQLWVCWKDKCKILKRVSHGRTK